MFMRYKMFCGKVVNIEVGGISCLERDGCENGEGLVVLIYGNFKYYLGREGEGRVFIF